MVSELLIFNLSWRIQCNPFGIEPYNINEILGELVADKEEGQIGLENLNVKCTESLGMRLGNAITYLINSTPVPVLLSSIMQRLD